MMGISSGISTGRHLVHCVPIELEFTNVDIQGEGKPEYPEKKTSQGKDENQQKTQSTYDTESSALTTAPSLLSPPPQKKKIIS